VAVVAIVIAMGAFVRAQVATPTFRAGTTLIEFNFVALDSKGNPVSDLTREDLILTEGSQARAVAFLRFDGGAPVMPDTSRPELPAGFVTNRPEPERNVVAILVDQLNVPVAGKYGQTSVRGLILQYLDSLPPNTRVGLFRFGELEPVVTLQPYTDRIDLLRQHISSMDLGLRMKLSDSASNGGGNIGTAGAREAMVEAEGRAVSGINSGIVTMRLNQTVASLESLGNHLAAIQGRKSLVWITNGPPVQFKNPYDSMIFEPRIRQAAQRMANQGIAVYPVSPGLAAVKEDDETEISTFRIFADVTGGRSVRNSNKLTEGVTLAANDQRGTYTLGFYAADEPNDEWHPLQVTVKRPGVTVRHRQGYLAVRRAQPQDWPAKSWNDLAYEALDSTGIRLSGRSDLAAKEVSVSLQIDAGDLYFHERDGQVIADLEIGLVEKTAKGPTNVRKEPLEVSLLDPARDQRSQLIPFKKSWSLNPATTSVRVIVRDRFTGRFGTLEMALGRR
jgi:VWFA-related protein